MVGARLKLLIASVPLARVVRSCVTTAWPGGGGHVPTIDERIMEKFRERLTDAPGVSSELADQVVEQLQPGKHPKSDELVKLISDTTGDTLS